MSVQEELYNNGSLMALHEIDEVSGEKIKSVQYHMNGQIAVASFFQTGEHFFCNRLGGISTWVNKNKAGNRDGLYEVYDGNGLMTHRTLYVDGIESSDPLLISAALAKRPKLTLRLPIAEVLLQRHMVDPFLTPQQIQTAHSVALLRQAIGQKKEYTYASCS